MSKVFFIADVHLNAHSPEVEARKVSRLIPFFEHVRQTSTCLYIVGDLYNFWFEYRHAIPRINLKVLAKLIELVEAGVTVHYLTGNHDLFHETYLCDEIGLQIHHNPMLVEHNGLKLFVAHGDDLAENDRKLILLRRIFESRLNNTLFRLIHPDIGIPLAHWVTGKSAMKGENKYEEDYINFARSKFGAGMDAVILGHTHKPICDNIDGKYYVNLGDWITKYTYLELNEQEFQLKTWVDSR
jgi:UDP-2,3-diacylglucosamine hydrolase